MSGEFGLSRKGLADPLVPAACVMAGVVSVIDTMLYGSSDLLLPVPSRGVCVSALEVDCAC